MTTFHGQAHIWIIEKRKLLENYFSNAKFNYCPLILKLHSCNINNVIRNLYESGLQLNFSDKNSSYEELLLKYGSVSIHHKNIQILMIEMQMSQEWPSSQNCFSIFCLQKQPQNNLWQQRKFRIPSVRSVYHGKKRTSYRRLMIWNVFPPDLQQLSSRISLKKQ